MTAQTYTHRDLAGLLGVSETTVKSYRSKFPGFLPVARQGKPVQLHAESLEVCRRIRDLFAEGLTVVQATERLRQEFKQYPQARRAPAPVRQPVPADADAGLDDRLESLAQAQELAWRRVEQLEAEVRNLATLEAASKALVAELLQELRASRQAVAAPAPPTPAPTPEPTPAPQPEPAKPPQPEPALSETVGPTVVTARKIVTVHGQAGAVASYALGREPKPEPLFEAPKQPEEAFLELPAVIRSERGEFLGLPGGQSVARLLEVLRPADSAPALWFAEGPESWTCELSLGPALTREFLFERTTTPRGNLVGLVRRVVSRSGSGVAEATPAEVQELFRQVRDKLG